jgi:hypothetical protein
LCSYNDIDLNGSYIQEDINASAGDAALRERLAKLEQMMTVMMAEKKEAQVSARGTLNDISQTLNDPTTPQTQNQRPSFTTNRSSLTASPVGQIVFREGEGAYFGTDFWPGLISEVLRLQNDMEWRWWCSQIQDVRRIFDAPGEQDTSTEWMSLSLLGMPSISSSTDIILTNPSLDESNMLLRLFFQSVNPFIRVLHQSLFARELDQYHRGTLIWPKEFEALLFSIYLLTVNSLRTEVAENVFLESKASLLERYQYAAQVSLTKMNFFKTQTIPGIWAVLHYIVWFLVYDIEMHTSDIFPRHSSSSKFDTKMP